MKKLLALGLVLLTLPHFLFAGNATPPEQLMVNYKLLYTYTQDSLDAFWKQKHIPQVVTRVRNAVDMYEVTYYGLWNDSTYIKAKGIMFIPKIKKPAAEMVYCHGTRISVHQGYGINDKEQVITMMHAADGYIAYFPFYYGLGGSEKEHVYQHSYTEAMSVIFMIKACREILPELGVKTTGQLFVTGYSQGGHAAMATHKMIESGRFPDMTITASSPMSGAYDMSGTQSKTMFQHYSRPHYLPYLLISWQYYYQLWPSDVYKIFKPPLDEELRELFKQPRKVSYSYLDKTLPKVPSSMVVDTLVEKFRSDSDFVFTKLLRQNDVAKWEPKAPIQLCACFADDQVLFENTTVTYNYMKSHGVNVYEKAFGKHLSHNPCAPFAVAYTKQFFDNIRKGRKHIGRVPFGKRLLLDIGIKMENKKARKKLKKDGELPQDIPRG